MIEDRYTRRSRGSRRGLNPEETRENAPLSASATTPAQPDQFRRNRWWAL